MRRLLLPAIASLLAACNPGGEVSEERLREMQEKIESSLPKTRERALRQEVPPETVRRVEADLATLHEFMDEPDGEIDGVTVNAIQAFQRSAGLDDDGLLDEKTLSELSRRAAAARSAASN